MENDRGIRRPNSRRNLDLALQRKCGVGASLVQARMAMACAIIGQLVPGAVVKGGMNCMTLKKDRFQYFPQLTRP